MCALAAAGHRVILLTATRGELGEVKDDFLAPGESLGERRSDELAAAAEILGVARLEFLGYRDSGMEGESTNEDAVCFAQADVEEAAQRCQALLERESVDVLVTYDEHGGYGHPDHVQVHRVGMRTAELLQVPVVYLSTMDRDFMRSVMADAASQARAAEAAGETPEAQPPDDVSEQVEDLGEPAERITTEIDVRNFLAQKRAAMAAHASQIDESSFFLALPEEAFAHVWGQEWYIRVRPTWSYDEHAGRQGVLTLRADEVGA